MNGAPGWPGALFVEFLCLNQYFFIKMHVYLKKNAKTIVYIVKK